MNALTTALAAAAWLAMGPAPPEFVTSDPNGGWSTGGYYVHNNMWNAARYSLCTSTLYARSHGSWRVVTRMNNETGDGAVKTYPNVHRNFDAVPLASVSRLTSRFAAKGPGTGIYNFAYDIWLNGIATPGCTEVMVWTENRGQTPGGKYVEDAKFGRRTYRVYRDPNTGYVALVAAANFSSGAIDLLAILKWVMARGWIPARTTLHQVCYGVEVVSTDDANATFHVTSFSIDARIRQAGRRP